MLAAKTGSSVVGSWFVCGSVPGSTVVDVVVGGTVVVVVVGGTVVVVVVGGTVVGPVVSVDRAVAGEADPVPPAAACVGRPGPAVRA
jgi:hypothetical protein